MTEESRPPRAYLRFAAYFLFVFFIGTVCALLGEEIVGHGTIGRLIGGVIGVILNLPVWYYFFWNGIGGRGVSSPPHSN
jgi:hypothetical protein